MSTFLSVLKQAAFLVLALTSSAVLAAAGTVTHLSGTLSVQRPDGSVRILSQKSEVNPGDLLTTQRDSYAQIAYTDGSSMTMRPNTQIRIDQYTFVQDRPQEDNSFLRLIKGGLRTVTAGRDEMPPFGGTFTPDQIRDISAYVIQALAGQNPR